MGGQRHILLCEERGVGKSTLIEKLLQACPRPRYGFLTRMEAPGPDGFRPVYLHPAGEPRERWTFPEEACVGVCDSRTHRPNLEVFNTLGVSCIEAARPGGILVMDELGFFEARAEGFTAAVLRALDGDIPVLAAVKARYDVPFLNAVRAHPRAEVFPITAENRDELFYRLLPRLRSL